MEAKPVHRGCAVIEIVVLTEEPSIKPVFECLEEKLAFTNAFLTIITHDGVSDLERSLPRKLRGWRNPNSFFLIVRDNDNGDCLKRKEKLQKIVDDCGRSERTLIRIVCQELEAWFLGDRQAMHDADILNINVNPANLRGNPDQLNKPSRILEEHLNGYSKLAGATAIAPCLSLDRNESTSFKATVDAIRRLAKEG